MLTTPSDELILQTIDILATANISDAEIETRVAALSPDACENGPNSPRADVGLNRPKWAA